MRTLLVGLIKGRVSRQENPKLSLDSYACFVTVTNPLLCSQGAVLVLTLEGLMVALSLAPLKGGDGCCG